MSHVSTDKKIITVTNLSEIKKKCMHLIQTLNAPQGLETDRYVVPGKF